MAIYAYKALDENGKVVRGKISARNLQELEAKLKISSLDLVNAKEVKASSIGFLNKTSIQDLILICVHLHQLEKAGVPILESIGDLRDEADSPLVKNIMMDVYDSLESGKLLSAAFKEHPKVFDDVFVSLVAAGEKTGNFADIFSHLERHLKWIADIKGKIIKAVRYPALMFCVLLGMVMMMMMYVIPKLSRFLLGQNIPLPWYSKALIATSDFVMNYWYTIIITPIILYFTIKFLRRISPAFAYQLDSLILKIPYAGGIIRKFEISRFCHFFSLTYTSGMGILQCLEISSTVVQNLEIKEAIISSKERVAEGQKITNALKATGVFPSLVLRMFKVGETSGNLDHALENVTHFYDQEVDNAVNALTELLQPMLTLVMGSMLGWITLSVFGPVYSNLSNIH